MKTDSTDNRELLSFLVARVTTLEATMEALLSFLPSLSNLPLAEQERRVQWLADKRAEYSGLFLENMKEQFPDVAPLIAEHMDLAFSKLEEKYRPKG
jgi:hypothetical protein